MCAHQQPTTPSSSTSYHQVLVLFYLFFKRISISSCHSVSVELVSETNRNIKGLNLYIYFFPLSARNVCNKKGHSNRTWFFLLYVYLFFINIILIFICDFDLIFIQDLNKFPRIGGSCVAVWRQMVNRLLLLFETNFM